MRTNLARVEPEETTRERRARLREEMQYRRALRLIVKTCCIWLGGAAYVLAVIAGYGHMPKPSVCFCNIVKNTHIG